MLTGLVGQVPDVTAPDLAVGIGSDPRFELHEASDLAAVPPELRFEVGSRLETVADFVAHRLPPLGPREHPLRDSAGPSRLTSRGGRREQHLDPAANASGRGR